MGIKEEERKKETKKERRKRHRSPHLLPVGHFWGLQVHLQRRGTRNWQRQDNLVDKTGWDDIMVALFTFLGVQVQCSSEKKRKQYEKKTLDVLEDMVCVCVFVCLYRAKRAPHPKTAIQSPDHAGHGVDILDPCDSGQANAIRAIFGSRQKRARYVCKYQNKPPRKDQKINTTFPPPLQRRTIHVGHVGHTDHAVAVNSWYSASQSVGMQTLERRRNASMNKGR